MSSNSSKQYAHPSVSNNTNIAGVAIDGKVINIIPSSKIDQIATEVNGITTEGRLNILTNYVKHVLKTSGERHGPSQAKVLLFNTLRGLESKYFIANQIKEIQARVQILKNNEKGLTLDNAEDIIQISDDLNELIDKWHEKNSVDQQAVI